MWSDVRDVDVCALNNMAATSRRRTREQLGDGAIIALKSDLTYGSKYALLDNICWTISELDGKYEGCRWWSRQAMQGQQELRHEHVVPRRVIISLLLDTVDVHEDRVRSALQLCVGAVVTKEEDRQLNSVGLRRRMPHDWDGVDVFARYKVAGIELVDLMSGGAQRAAHEA